MIVSEPELTCRELVELVTDYLEGKLVWRDRVRFERHLAGCDGCTGYIEQMRAAVTVAGTLREDDLEPPVRDALLQAFRGWSRSGS